MRKAIVLVGILAVWSLLAWGNIALISLTNTNYQERMDANYLLSSYSGRVLLTQDEYTQFKQFLLNPEVAIHKLDVYGSNDVLILYDITVPDDCKSVALAKPQSQDWKYDKGRFMDYAAHGFIVMASLIAGGFLTVGITSCKD